jgi:hypothetical protein
MVSSEFQMDDVEIFIEIGTEEQKKLIFEELKIIQYVTELLDKPPIICSIWVPEDFDKKVNDLEKTSNYTSDREHLAIAKNVITDNGTHLVFSKRVYTEFFDSHMRMQLYLHELIHAMNKMEFPKIPNSSPSKELYYENLYILFDEYTTHRKSLYLVEKVCNETSLKYKDHIKSEARGFLQDFINIKHYEKIQKEIVNFRYYGKARVFLENTKECLDTVSKALVYFYSYIDQYPKYCRYERLLPKSKFYGVSAIKMINYFRSKHETNDFDLLDGLDYIKCYMDKFGVHYEDGQHRLCFRVVDI